MHSDTDHTGSAPSIPKLKNQRRSIEALPDAAKENGAHLLVNDQCKYKSMWTRTSSTLWMIGGLAFMVYMGHLYMCTAHLPGFRILNWRFFTAMLFVYGRLLSQPLVNTVTSGKVLYKLVSNLVKYQMAMCYFLYIAADNRFKFVWFILALKKKMYKYQFGQFAWTHMILIEVFTQSSFTVANIFEGIFWFLLPASLIVMKDIAAYLDGQSVLGLVLIQVSVKEVNLMDVYFASQLLCMIRVPLRQEGVSLDGIIWK